MHVFGQPLPPNSTEPGLDATLVGDLGGTHLRLARLHPDRPLSSQRHAISSETQFWSTLESVTADIHTLILSVAGPVSASPAIPITNRPWSLDATALLTRLSLTRLIVTNDIAALAYTLPDARTASCIRPSRWDFDANASPTAPMLVIGVGTGLGAAIWTPAPTPAALPQVLPTEAGHITLPAETDEQWQVIHALRQRWERVSAERIVSGAGLAVLYATLRQLDGLTTDTVSPAFVSAATDDHALRTRTLFATWLGTVVGDLVLATGTWGGVLISGGALIAMGSTFDSDAFLAAFDRKGRFTARMSDVPIFLHQDPEAALSGLARQAEALLSSAAP